MTLPGARSGDRRAEPPLALVPARHRLRAEAADRLSIDEQDAATGVVVRRVAVADPSDASPTRSANRAVLAVLDELLGAHPDWRAPLVDGDRVRVAGNPVGEWLYRSPALTEWRTQLVPSAAALLPAQRWARGLPSGADHDDTTRMVLLDSLDAAGIRSRAAVMARLVADAAGAGGGRWVSLACGAAVPVLDACREVVAAGGAAPVLHLVDLDPAALAFAARLAEAEGLVVGSDVQLLRRDLVRTVVAGTALLDELGEGRAGLVDALGIFEYFSDAACVRLLRHAFRLLAPGGVLVVANMLADRPQLAFNQRGAGWPRLHVRTVEELVDLVRRAGLPLARTTVTLPTDGVYAVVDVVR